MLVDGFASAPALPENSAHCAQLRDDGLGRRGAFIGRKQRIPDLGPMPC